MVWLTVRREASDGTAAISTIWARTTTIAGEAHRDRSEQGRELLGAGSAADQASTGAIKREQQDRGDCRR